MNETHVNPSAPALGGLKTEPAWSRQRWLTLVALVFAAQLSIIFFLGEKNFPPPRPAGKVPQLALADESSELIALEDPTLFALPHANDFGSPVWRQMFAVRPPDFRWPEPPRWLPLASNNLGAVFSRFMQTNQFSGFQLDFRPPAKLSEPILPVQPVFAENSVLHIEGELAQRKLLNPVSLRSWPYADVIAPSRVQVLVDANGYVVSAVLLPPTNPVEAAAHYNAADAEALAFARTVRFSPAARLTAGRLIFVWRTVPMIGTNTPVSLP